MRLTPVPLFLFVFLRLNVLLSLATPTTDRRSTRSPIHGFPRSEVISQEAATIFEANAPIVHITEREISVIRKRVNALTLHSARRHTQIVPVQYAASSLWLFYSALERQARGPWRFNPEQDELWVKLGNLRLCFVSLDGVPWNFVAWFAAKMINATLLGYTGTYDMVYLDPDDTNHGGVLVWLRVIDHVTGMDVDKRDSSGFSDLDFG